MRRYTMQDRSGGRINRTDRNLSLVQVYEMTDYTEEEFDAVASLLPGQEMFIGSGRDIYVLRQPDNVGTMRVVLSKQGDSFLVDPVDKPGSPRVGRGRTMLEAYGNFLIQYQDELGLLIEVDPSGQAAEDRRRSKARK